MTNRKVHSLFRNNTAVVGKPIALLVILIIAGVILTLFFLMIPDLIKETQRQNVEGELDKIVVEATTMFEYAENGTCKTLAVKFPSSLRFVVFGSAPTHGTNEPTNLNLDEHTSNNYYYVMDDGTIHPFHSNARFSNYNMTQIALFHPGSYTITLRLCEKGRNTYVTMQ